jgi:hypothetical protein
MRVMQSPSRRSGAANKNLVLASSSNAGGFYLLAGKLTDLSLGAQTLDIIIAGAGLGLMLGVASTDAVNRAPSSSYGGVSDEPAPETQPVARVM